MDAIFDDEYFMKKALQEAEAAFEKGEVPVGAVIVVEKLFYLRKKIKLVGRLPDASDRKMKEEIAKPKS